MLQKILPRLLIILAYFLAVNKINGQEKYPGVKVFSDNRMEYDFPWAGGMNSCQFDKVDINLDGLKDLVVFDRAGDRIIPFLVVQSGSNYEYKYAPEFAVNFPVLSHWVIFADYDLDGKEDIFTYSPGYAGLKVYRNTSGSALEFALEVFPFLTSFQGGGYVNILVTYADYPAITDLDGDGDLDILTFWGLGSFVEKHRNMSMEKYGHADSLDFEKTEFCWGYFAESEESNDLTLDTCLRCESGGAGGHGGMEAWGHRGMEDETRVGWKAANCELGTANREQRHTGSTFQVLDLNGDGLSDLLLGDVDYPNLVALYNGGSPDTARMVSYDGQYPPYDKAVSLFSMPAAFNDDFDFDGIKDLLVSPFDPNPFLTENFRSVWLYHNDGTNSAPLFHTNSMSFIQDRMIDLGAGAYPVFYDIDQDGLVDLFAGNYGYYDTSYLDEFLILHTEQTGKLAFFKNTGTQDIPAFTFAERDFATVSNLDLRGIVPAFGDLDGDGDIDMLLGCETGQIILYLNTAGNGNPVNLQFNQSDYQGIDIGAYSTPQLFDLDNDNLDDLIIGEKGGNLNYFRNTGTLQKPAFTLVTDSLGKVNVTDPAVSLDGYSVPFFFRDAAEHTHLLVGSEQGVIYYFTGIDGNLAGKFTESDTLAGLIGLEEFNSDRGYRTAPALYDLDQNGHLDLIAGNFSGGMEYFASSSIPPVAGLDDMDLSIPDVVIYPVPAAGHFIISMTDPGSWRIAGVKILTMDGRVIYFYDYDKNLQLAININFDSNGLYVCQVLLKEMNTMQTHSYQSKLVLVF